MFKNLIRMGVASLALVALATSCSEEQQFTSEKTDAKREGLYTLENLNANGSNYGMSSYTGEITLNKEGKEATKPAITLIVRDESGAIVYGYTTYLMSELSVGVPTPFEITAFGVPDTAATFEVSATPWM